jgi:hypothetical protein
MKALIVHYSLFGHTHFLAEAIEKGASGIEGTIVEMRPCLMLRALCSGIYL